MSRVVTDKSKSTDNIIPSPQQSTTNTRINLPQPAKKFGFSEN